MLKLEYEIYFNPVKLSSALVSRIKNDCSLILGALLKFKVTSQLPQQKQKWYLCS